MNIDAIRRAWQAASESSGVPARLVAVGDEGAPGEQGELRSLRGRTGAAWADRLRFELALAEALGDSAGFDLQWLAPRPTEAADRARGRLGVPQRGPGEVVQRAPDPARRAERRVPTVVPGVAKVIAVASGKGGVGKSTTAVNLACALADRGLAVGLLDADVYGPSIPTMLGSFQAPTRVEGRFIPARAHGLPFLSLGLMVNPDQSVMWRGPLVQRMVRDLLQKTTWPELDVLVLDLPPGTGDVQISLVQRSLLAGAVIVTTPQDIALIDAARAVQMFTATDVPVFGLIENMSGWSCPSCGHEAAPFGQGGGEREAERLGLPFLGRVPLLPAVREGGDRGEPIVRGEPESEPARAIAAIAEELIEQLGLHPKG
jgi:ATP-binding protein involved in chromosome partitioning